MNSAKELIMQQQKEALEELAKTTVALVRLRKLIREQDSYEPAAFEESAKALMGTLGERGRRFVAHLSILIALRCGRVKGVQTDTAGGES